MFKAVLAIISVFLLMVAALASAMPEPGYRSYSGYGGGHGGGFGGHGGGYGGYGGGHGGGYGGYGYGR